MEYLLATAFGAFLAVVSGVEIGDAIKSIANGKYIPGGISAMLGVYLALNAAKTVFCW